MLDNCCPVFYNTCIENEKREMIMYQPMTYDFSNNEETLVYYYNINTDTFHTKIEWLDQNELIDRIIVDADATAQEIDEIFEAIYPHYNTDLKALLDELNKEVA